MIVFKNVTKRYDNGTIAVDDLSLEAPKGRITIFVGPSGCGKTTSLRMINRLIAPTSGSILLDGQPTEAMNLAQLRRKIGYVIQHAGLFPHLNVVQNIATTARLKGIAKKQALLIASELLERVGLDLSFGNRYPWQLSGGQQQRVGVARALASDPEFMLMDEPFSAVDPVVRHQLQEEFLRLQRDIGKTIIMVTHDIDEALKLGDQVAVLRTGGVLAQVASPKELLSNPADSFVADFVGRDRGYRYLSFVDAASSLAVMIEPVVALGTEAAAARIVAKDQWILVVNAAAQPLGWVDLDRQSGPLRESDLNLSGTLASQDHSLRQVLDAALSAPSGRGVIVDAGRVLAGSVRLSDVVAAIQSAKAAGWGGRP
ncbi:ABC transporter ATP-binding protein [Acidisoma silvae]|uniref:ABC transporter ATP-binding protein n=1 Tax=Acidisoma silvae TaxID=2802396 RepID=A0A963YWR5_9PROT|nr:ABC transporter ATP-binding protein [Acidisoma silvae]MCB8877782.1 ABC transporter ATP-binding protein [Acidisoma silvae]